MINLIPNLKPQIKHSEITQAIDKLQSLSEQDNINITEFDKLVEFFKNKEFYLSSEECEKINKLRKKIDEKNINFDEISIVDLDLKPNKDMNETYYLDK